MTTAAPPELADPKLWKQLEAVATIYSRGYRWLRDDLDSACNLAVAKACAEWDPGRGVMFRTYAVFLAHRECQSALIAARPKGFRADRRKAEAPAVASLEGLAERRELDPNDLVADGSPAPDDLAEHAELARIALGALGVDAPVITRWLDGETIMEIGTSIGVSKQRFQQRIDRGIVRAKKAVARAV